MKDCDKDALILGGIIIAQWIIIAIGVGVWLLSL